MEALRDRRLVLGCVLLGILLAGLALYLKISYVLVLFLGLIFLALVFENPSLGLVLTLLAYVFLPDILALGLVYGVFFTYLISKLTRGGPVFRIYSQETPYYMYFILMVIACFSSIMVTSSLRDLAIHLGGLGLMLMILDQVEDERGYHNLLVSLVMVASILSLIGIAQHFIGVDLQREWVDTSHNKDIQTRVYSVFGNPNIFAEFLVMIIPLSVGIFWQTKRDGVKLFYLGLFLIQVLALFMTMSRGGWVGLGVAALVFVLLVKKRLALLAIPLGGLGLAILPPTVINRALSIFNFADSSTSYRFKMWEITGQMIADRPIFGVGLGHQPFKYTFETYIRTMPVFHSHNTYLQVLAEMGILGLVLFILLLLAILGSAYYYLIRSQRPYRRIMGAALMASFAGLLTHGMFENILYLTKISLTFWVLVALVFALVRLEKREREGEDLEASKHQFILGGRHGK